MADVQQGTNVTIAADIAVEGVLTFAAGEQVTVQQVAPNPQRPEYKYTVFSAKTGKWFMLRDADIMAPQPAAYAPPPIPPQQQQAPYTQPPPGPQQQFGAPAPPRAAGAGVDFSGMESSDWLVAIGGIIMFLSMFIYFGGYLYPSAIGGLGLIVLVVLDKLVRVPAITDWRGLTVLYIVVGAIGVFFGLLSLLNVLLWWHATILGIHAPISWYIGPVIDLLASGAVLAGGLMRRKEGY